MKKMTRKKLLLKIDLFVNRKSVNQYFINWALNFSCSYYRNKYGFNEHIRTFCK